MVNRFLRNKPAHLFDTTPLSRILMEPHVLPPPQRVILLLKGPARRGKSAGIQVGDGVRTGQKLTVSEEGRPYVISSVTGKVSAIYPYTGDFGNVYTAVAIERAVEEAVSDEFEAVRETPSLEAAAAYLNGAPGGLDLDVFSNPEKPIHTLIINAVDNDLLVATNQYIITSKASAVKAGAGILKKITGIGRIVIAVPRNIVQNYGSFGTEVAAVDAQYPATLPYNIVREVIGRETPAGKRFEDIGVAFLNVESVAAIGSAFETGRLPVSKVLTLIRKNETRVVVEARLGTSVGDVLRGCGETAEDRDRIVIGGPMRGSCIYSEGHPVLPDTDAILVQDGREIVPASDYPCTNCGECVRICPARIQVNMLIRFLEAGKYEEAADLYDLYSCIECGLCSYVCVSRVPIFQYIRLAKYELERTRKAEASR
ncbi:MAG: 4Fe-4S dicluster domain-containing protein [Desulfobacteraceae bacterium]|nr:MAG: 4Fe-4S dicluster domain-containing protein [Desulfobacteraceae bacterium]